MALADIDLDNPDNFLSGTPHHWFRELRRESPVHWHKERSGPGFWCITKYEDVKQVSRNPLLFSSWQGGTNIPDEQAMIMLNMDPPQHVKFRRIVQRGFTPQMTAKQEPYLRALSKRIVDAVASKGECEFVEELAAELPLQVICELMGVPVEDRKLIFEWSNKLIGFDDEFRTTRRRAPRLDADVRLRDEAGRALQHRAGNTDHAHDRRDRRREADRDRVLLVLPAALGGGQRDRHVRPHARPARAPH
jgi:cytochrome P450